VVNLFKESLEDLLKGEPDFVKIITEI